MPDSAAPASVAADYFDGRSARAHAVRLRLHDEVLHVDGDGVALRVPVRSVQWPERTRHGARVANLPDGASLHGADAAAWDAWWQACGGGESWVVRLQQSWRGVAASAVLLMLLLGGAWRWGVPGLGMALVALTPPHVEATLGEAALRTVDEQWMQASTLPAAQQARLRAVFARVLAAQPPGSVPAHRLEFRRSRIGPNAFALPGGTLVMTDQLVTLVQGDEDIIVGVLAHELGHVRHRHGMRLLVQSALVGALAGAVLGDFSTLLAGVPVLLGQAGYSRDAEREADAHAAQMLRTAGISPAVMARFFERVAVEQGPDRSASKSAAWSRLQIAIASHPPDAERIRFFRQAPGP